MSILLSNETRSPLPGGAVGERSLRAIPGSSEPAGQASSAPRDPFLTPPIDRFRKLREAAFFPVRREPVCLAKNGQPVPGYRAIVGPEENGKERIFSVVSEGYRLLLNEQVVEIGRRLFAKLLGDATARDMVVFDWGMPESRASFHADFTAPHLYFEVSGDGHWGRFLRVKNSYNKSCQVRFSIGAHRFHCGNNLLVEASYPIVGGRIQDAHSRTMEEWIRDLDEQVITQEDVRRFDAERIRTQLARIRSVPVPGDDFLAGLVGILGIAPPASFGPSSSEDRPRRATRRPSPGQWRYWGDLGGHLERLAQQYRASQGDNAFALLNAATDYASDGNAPGMHVERLSGLQARCGAWLQELDRPGTRFEVSADDRAAAERLQTAAGGRGHFSSRFERS